MRITIKRKRSGIDRFMISIEKVYRKFLEECS